MILGVLLGATACGANANTEPVPQVADVGPETAAVAVEAAQTTPPVIESLLNGLPVSDDKKHTRPIAVMLDNHIGARPQAGLSEADVVVEALVEGEITRYMALFQSKYPESIGPVRSARPYFVDMAQAYDAYYVHAGGSPDALDTIVRRGIPDIDSLHEGKVTFWRKNHKKAPHNLYTSAAAVQSAANARGYRTQWIDVPMQFHEGELPSDGTAFTRVVLKFKVPGTKDKTSYTASFTADSGDGRMSRQVNGKPHVDETTDLALYAENLIIQLADHRVLDAAGRLQIELIGSGDGYYCNKGRYWPIKWYKKDSKTPVEYSYAEGSPLHMPPGMLWIEIFPANKDVLFE